MPLFSEGRKKVLMNTCLAPHMHNASAFSQSVPTSTASSLFFTDLDWIEVSGLCPRVPN